MIKPSSHSNRARIAPRALRRLSVPFVLLLPLLAMTAAGCGVETVDPDETVAPAVSVAAASPTASGPTATPTADLQALLRDGGISIIQTAYDRLLDEYIDPLAPPALLAAAWAGVERQAVALGLTAPSAPAFGDDRAAAFDAFREAYVPLANGTDEAQQLRFAAIRGMTESLQDCHTFFLNPVASDTLIDTRSGRGAVGIGVELAGVPPLVIEVITGSPADRAGVLVGDRIAAIDGADASALGPAGALDLVNGDEGTSVRLELTRPGEAAAVALTVPRARVTPPNVESRVVDGLGYVRVRNFVDDGVRPALEAALAGFERQGARGWIIDIRGNPGGRLDTDAISLWVPDGVVVRDRGRGGLVEEFRANGDGFDALRPTVVLTDHRTGSVAEVFAAALQEYGVAYIIGARTNGCAGFTDVREFGDGSSMAVTTHVNLGPVSNAELNGVGVVPDLQVARTEADIASLRDPQLDAAIAHLAP